MGWFKKLIKGVGRGVKGLIKGIGGAVGGGGSGETKITLALPPGYTSQSQGMQSLLPNVPGVPGLDNRSWIEKNWIMLAIGFVFVLLMGFIGWLVTSKKK